MTVQRDYLDRWQDAKYVANYINFTESMEIESTNVWIERLRLGPGATVIDLGCGDTKVLACIASAIERGIGIDASRHMLASGQARLNDLGISNVELIEADLRDVVLETESGSPWR